MLAMLELMSRCWSRSLEPPWKAVLANKGLLPFLWEMFEGHPNLLPSYFEGDPRAADLSPYFVRKPLLSRQGWNVEIHGDDDVAIRMRTRYAMRFGDQDAEDSSA